MLKLKLNTGKFIYNSIWEYYGYSKTTAIL